MPRKPPAPGSHRERPESGPRAFGPGSEGSERRKLVTLRRLGLVPYREALALQEKLVRLRRAGEVPDTLLLLEHPHVITAGSGADPEHVLADEAERRRLGVELCRVGRGGDVTYHGPGQLVAYPIMDLKPDRKDLNRYLRDLEETAVRAARTLGVPCAAREGLTGVWTERGKLAAIGVRVSSGWITSHGLALNVQSDLSYFETIVPCGIPEARPTSLEAELGRKVSMRTAEDVFAEAFGSVFERRLNPGWRSAPREGPNRGSPSGTPAHAAAQAT